MSASPIDHLFVLMLENRSFDHVFAARPEFAPAAATRVNIGLEGVSYPQARMVGGSARHFLHDPPHDASGVAMQIASEMGGFVQALQLARPGLTPAEYAEVMHYLGREDMPVTHFLADHFAISDHWFSAIPTGTIPNRMYAMCGHSAGDRDNPDPIRYAAGYDIADSIFHQLDQKRVDWRIYSGTLPPWATMIRDLRGELFDRRGRLRSITHLARHLRELRPGETGNFPKFVWLEPSYSWTEFPLVDAFYTEPNCDHPPSDLRRGQALIEYVYDALRNSAIWSRSALVILYDEHGGFYDHVPPPACTPGTEGFARRGPRVPAIVVSPFTERGAVVQPPPGQCFDHCSVLKFLSERFDIAPWTPRIADPTTASLSAFFDPARASPAPGTGHNLWQQEALRIDLRSERKEPDGSHEGACMRQLVEQLGERILGFFKNGFDDD